ncbi:GUN4 domain-containing protein [Crocosphaera sp. XPORK-15E]|uniref:GUN4 domain-containing protein n=1 Tax=Crocosphaera sp. XPORK-15E TaxID=3110247 RepID=UPI002B21331B|nr:GUN4 domain-containing protein [Crocosphaera sp. XPORK-15E]MEA5537105.1 GUN4 domain-containing protein [Crocosphaera sp. XPORK-15E]
MAKNWAVCIGINNYVNMPDLKCANNDAQKMKDWFLDKKKGGFEKVYLFTDDSPPINDTNQPYNSQPNGNTLKRFFRVRFKPNILSVEDNLWFFFSGHGLLHNGKDYLMPSDGDPDPKGVEDTAISLSYITSHLRQTGAGNVIIIYDACRNEVGVKGIGMTMEKQKGVITLASCSPTQKSYEIDEILQGSFTYALLEALENTLLNQGNYATFDRLYQRLKYRVPEINRQYGKPEKQQPYGYAEPDEKRYCILLPKQATIQDLNIYYSQALKAKANDNIGEAKIILSKLLAILPNYNEIKEQYELIIPDPKSDTDKNGITPPQADNSPPTENNDFRTDSISNICSYLEEVGLKIEKEKYQDFSAKGEEYRGNSDPKQLEQKESEIKNSITYYITGTQNKINQLKIIFSLNKKINKGKVITYGYQLSDQTKILINKGLPSNFLNSKIFEKIENNIVNLFTEENAENIKKIKLGNFVIKIVREDWPSNEGYDIKLIIEADYSKLEDLLAAKKWREADEETVIVMLQAANKVEQVWLDYEDIENIPCEDLQAIDQLWVKYSNGKFGFSVQKKIYIDDLGGTNNYDPIILKRFCYCVGWMTSDKRAIPYENLSFDLLNTIPNGHLPNAWISDFPRLYKLVKETENENNTKNLFDRMGKTIKENLRDLVGQAEDPSILSNVLCCLAFKRLCRAISCQL